MTLDDLQKGLAQHLLIESVCPTKGNNALVLTACVDDWPALKSVLLVRGKMTFRIEQQHGDDNLWTRAWRWLAGRPRTALTVESICRAIGDAVDHEATKGGGPDLEDTPVMVSGQCDEESLRKVLDAKGHLVLQLRALPSATIDEAAGDQIKRMREMYGIGLPLNQVGNVVTED